MRAVNLVPQDSRSSRLGGSTRSGGAVYAVLGLLAVALLFVTILVLDANTISSRRATLARLQTQAQQARITATRLAPYTVFAALAQARVTTVRQIAAARFDWHGALENLARVVPSDTSLQSLNGTVAPGASAGGSAASGGDLRGDIASPAIELTGCTRTQDDVATLISRLRTMNGVARVSLQTSQKGSDTTSGGSGGCPSGSPAFDLVVWYQPIPGAGPDGLTTASGSTATGTAGSTASASSTPATTSTPTATSTPATTSTPAASSTPAATSTPASSSSGSTK